MRKMDFQGVFVPSGAKQERYGVGARRLVLLILVMGVLPLGGAESVSVRADQPYGDPAESDDYQKARCQADVYVPGNARGQAPVVIWFHGGALSMGSKAGMRTFGEWLAGQGVVTVIPNYRLSPKALFPAYVQDAAKAVAWAKAHAAEFGGDPNRVFVGGYSAGGYLAGLLAMDHRFLAKEGIGEAGIAGYVFLSGQMMTHYAVRAEQGLAKEAITADAAAPVHYCRAQTPPILLLVGDSDKPARLEENAYFAAAMKAAGNENIRLEVIPQRTHGTIATKMREPNDPAGALVTRFVTEKPR